MRKARIFALLVIFIGLLGPAATTTLAQETQGGDTPVFPENPQEGILYRLPECDPDTASIDQPCYVILFSHIDQDISSDQAKLENTKSSWTITCGVNVKNAAQTLVAKLWQDINASWNQSGSWYFPSVNWKSRGTWTKDWRYTWSGLSGPYYDGGGTQSKIYSTSGTLKYLGINWSGWKVSTTLWNTTSPPSWSCNWNKLW
ncbi:MAG: hypothetical protein U5K99_07510 [Anaerolineales bacterium]|nr:hypothetical protein [Anaerolineales bacterium]